MGESPRTPSFTKPPEDRLDSWKEIAVHLNRDVTTVQRWEKREGMPIHRHLHDRSGSVYAYKSELDAWQQSRKLTLEEQKTQTAEPSANAGALQGPAATRPVRRWLIWGGVAALGFLVLTLAFIRSRSENAIRPKIKALAVLPLKNLSGDPAQEYLADGMTEAIIGRLSAIHDLRVISRTSVMRFKDTQLSVPEIAKTLNVDAIVEGSVIHEGSRIRVHAQLIRASTDEHFWSEAYDRELRDALALESDVAQSIARKVEITVTGEEHARLIASRSVAPEVYESYLKGRFAGRNSRSEVEQKIAYFEEAIKKDASFAPAYVGLAAAYDILGTNFVGARPDEARAKSMSAARQALELDPGLAEAHALLANELQRQWQWADAEAEYRRALEFNPNDAAAHSGFAGWLLCQGRIEEALAWARRGRELDPLGSSGEMIAWILFQDRRYDDAMKELRSILAVHPDDTMALWYLGFVLIGKGQAEQAIPVLEKTLSLTDRSPGVIGVLVRAYAHAGRRGDALQLLAELKKRRQEGYIPAGAFVNAYLGLDDKKETFVWLEQAYQEKSTILQFLKRHPYFDPIRDDARFKDLLHRVGLS